MSPESVNPEQPIDLALAERLAAARPVPAAGFRGTLGRLLREQDPGFGPRPAGLWPLALAYLVVGLLALGAAALVASGAL